MRRIILLLIAALFMGGAVDAQVKKGQRKKAKTTATSKTKQSSQTTAQTAITTSSYADKFKAKAEAGDAEAQYELADCYFHSMGVNNDFAKAMEWAKKSSEQGFSLGSELVGRMYLYGYGVEKNEATANQWFKLAYEQARPLAEAGDARAQYTLNILYKSGRSVQKNMDEAFKWLTKSASLGYYRAQYSLGVRYNNGEGVAQNEQLAVEWYRKAAEQGFPFAQFILANKYDGGTGVAQNKKLAFEWYRKAAEQEHVKAQYSLGLCYDNGTGVAQNKKLAFEWYRKAAEHGLASAQCNLGYCYGKGAGVAQNKKLAFEWYRKAAKQGDKTAKNNLEILNDRNETLGIVIPIDPPCEITEEMLQKVDAHTRDNYKKALDGDTEAMLSMSRYWSLGYFGYEDKEEALRWAYKAANLGNAEAQCCVGDAYDMPDSYCDNAVLKNYFEAAKWYAKAASNGYKDANDKLDMLVQYDNITKNQLKVALEQAGNKNSQQIQSRAKYSSINGEWQNASGRKMRISYNVVKNIVKVEVWEDRHNSGWWTIAEGSMISDGVFRVSDNGLWDIGTVDIYYSGGNTLNVGGQKLRRR